MESKRKNIYIAVFVITTLIASCLATYFGITKNSESQELQAKIDELNNSINDTNSSNIDSSNTPSKEDLVKKFNSITYDSNKITSINDPDFDSSIFTRITKDYHQLCYVSLVLDSQDVEITYANSLLENITTNVQPNMVQHIEGFNQKITDFIVGGYSQDIIFPMAFFLMEDGTISYLNTKKAAQTGDFTVSHNLNNLKNIVKLERLSGYVDGYIAIDIDGNSYNLARQFIEETRVH